YDTLDFFHDMGYYFSDYLREEFIYDTPQVENEDHIIGVENPEEVEYDSHITGVGSSEPESYPDNEPETDNIGFGESSSNTFESNDNVDHITGVGSSEPESYPDNGNFS
ncbi:MAG: hypothetical protein WCG45_02285, partial [bacterium]